MANNNPTQNPCNLAEAIYTAIQDLDFCDYADTMTADIQSLENDIALLQKHSNGAILQAIEMLTENN